MARQGLPKKYAKMGFKKGWAVYKKTKPVRTHRYVANKRVSPYKKRRKPVSMARRRSYKKKAYRYARGGGGAMKPIIDGVLVGAARGFLNGKIPFGSAIATLGVGFFRNNATLKTLGGIELGQALLGGVLGGGNGGGGGVR